MTAPRAKYVVDSMEEGVSGLRHEAKTKADEAEFLGDLIWRLEQSVKFYQSEFEEVEEHT